MKKKTKSIIFGIATILLLTLCSGCIDSNEAVDTDIKGKITGTGTITDKWEAIVDDGYGASTGYFFIINNSYYIGATPLEYHMFDVNETFSFSWRYKNPGYSAHLLPHEE